MTICCAAKNLLALIFPCVSIHISLTIAFHVRPVTTSFRSTVSSGANSSFRSTKTYVGMSVQENNKHTDLNPESLPSTYDKSLPAGLRGEAVRSALKSERGTCMDFTSLKDGHSVKNVGVVKVSGKGTASFLNNKLSNTFPERIGDDSSAITRIDSIRVDYGLIKDGGLLNSKGQIIDNLAVAIFSVDENESNGIEGYMITSPGHEGSQLFDRLDPFIFPLDGVKLIDMCPGSASTTGGKVSNSSTTTKVLTFAATKSETVQNCIRKNALPIIFQDHKLQDLDSWFMFPNEDECLRYTFDGSHSDANDDDSSAASQVELIILQQKVLSPCICRGYTVIISNNSSNNSIIDLGSQVWDRCTSESNYDGPVALGPLEYETLRIEGCQPGFGFEMTGNAKDKIKNGNDSGNVRNTRAGPLELYLNSAVDVSKGCYQGQESVAALLKNKRGLPRTLYSVIFPEEDNFYEGQEDEEQYSNHEKRIENGTKLPQVGDDLYVLGSDRKIKVGTLTSVAERGSTSLPETVAMALVKRPDPILKKMKEMDLEIDRDLIMGPDSYLDEDADGSGGGGSGIIIPPPLDPLDGLEVLLANGFTQGYLRVIPSRRLRKNQNLFEIEQWSAFDGGQEANGSVMGFVTDESDQVDQSPMEMFSVTKNDADAKTLSTTDVIEAEDEAEIEEDIIDEELQASIEAADAAAQEAKRKEDKMLKLKAQAEEAMKRRRAAKEAASSQREKETDKKMDEDAAAVEAQRKSEKMEMLRKRAEKAMARRQKKKD